MPKTKRWAFRVACETDQVVRQSATTANSTLTDFVVDAAVTEAERILADRTQFALDPVEWTRFVELLDSSPKTSPGSRSSSPSRAYLPSRAAEILTYQVLPPLVGESLPFTNLGIAVS